MSAEIMMRDGKEFAVLPYEEYLELQERLEDFEDLKALREAKANPDYLKQRPLEEFGREMGFIPKA